MKRVQVRQIVNHVGRCLQQSFIKYFIFIFLYKY